MGKRTPEREEFLKDALTIAIENGGYGFFSVSEWKWEDVTPGETYAVIHESGEEEDQPQTWRVDIETMAKGIGVIKSAVLKDFGGEVRTTGGYKYTTPVERVLSNAQTGERLYVSEEQRRNIMLAERTNMDEGDLDAIDGLAILECALFGRVVYA